MTGKVWLVGAGPGDRGLFTLKGLEILQDAEVVVHDALIGDEIMTLIPENAEKINVGKRAGNHRMPQEEINRILLGKAQEGRRVVRLKGGDPFVFARGGEELALLAQHNIPYEVVPGVTSAFAVPAYNGIPVSHRDYTQSVHIITGHRRSERTASGVDGLDINYDALVRTRGTLIFLMGLSTLPLLMNGLLAAGMDPDMPAAVLEKGTMARQRRILATVSTLEEAAAREKAQAPAIIVVGRVCSMAESFAWAEKRPLAGKKILLTRPKELISETAFRLRRLGAEVLELPAIKTVPIEPNPELDEYLKSNFDGDSHRRPDWLIFTSPTGVRVFMDRFLAERDVRALWGTRIAAIGEGSAKKLRQYGIRADFIPSVYDGETLGRELAEKIRQERAAAEGLVLQQMKDEAGKKSEKKAEKILPVRILIPRASIGNRELIDELKKAGNVDISDISTYNTEYKTSGIIDVRTQILSGGIDYAVFTSASTVRGFSALMEGCDLSGVKAVCIGRQTGAAAEALGMNIRIAKKATIDALVEAAVEWSAENA